MLLKLVSFLLIMLSVAFFTLLQRKILGMSAIRISVNKVFVAGFFQPLLDAVKLLSKEMKYPQKSKSIFYIASPIFLFCFCISLWESVDFFCSFSVELSLLFFLLFLGLCVFPNIMTGWFSGSKYSSLGALRVGIVSVSFEVIFALVVLAFFLFWKNLTFLVLLEEKVFLSFMFVFFWFFLSLIDTMTPPFDLGEAESELVSGFNTEHASFSFVMLFLAEYSMMVLFSFLLSFLFLGGSFLFFLATLSLMIFSQSTYMRMKSDWVMSLMWWKILPLFIFLFFVFLFV